MSENMITSIKRLSSFSHLKQDSNIHTKPTKPAAALIQTMQNSYVGLFWITLFHMGLH